MNLINQIFQASARSSRSTVLADLKWLLGLILAALVGCVRYGAPPWIIIVLSVFAGIVLVLALGAFIYFARHHPDALRSERFTIDKQMVERGIVGDSLSGFHAVAPAGQTPKALQAVAAEERQL